MIRAAAVLSFALVAACAHAPVRGPASYRLQFRVRAPDGYTPHAGRIIVAMSNDAATKDPRQPHGFVAAINDTWWAAVHVERLAPGEPIDVDPDLLASPRPFSQAPRGAWTMAAMFVPDGADGSRNELRSNVVARLVDPARAGRVDLVFAPPSPPPPVADSASVKIVRAPSARLSAFYGRPTTIDALVLLPASYASDATRSYGTIYTIQGFGGTLEETARHADAIRKRHAAAKEPEAVFVVLSGMTGAGHHGFIDSVNHGPWLSAFVDDLIPFVERSFRVVKDPAARLLGGHSSGGWASLWVMLHRPDAFAGTWSTSPDPVDLRDFIGVDVTPGSRANYFREHDGSPRRFLRMGGKDMSTIERFWKWEQVMGEVGAMGTFEWEWSPRGADGRPLPLFDRATGALVAETLRAWEPFDIRKLVEAQWTTLGPKLAGKLHLFCGSIDNFHLDGALRSLCATLAAHGSDAECEIVPGRDHMDLFGGKTPNELALRIAREHKETLARAGVRTD